MQSQFGYKSYILRVWQVERDAEPTLIAALEDCQTNERRAFPSLAALLEFLEVNGWQALPSARDSQSQEEKL